MSDDAKLAWEKRKFLITAAAGIFLFLIGLWQFSITSRNDFAKPVLVKQLELCVEASNAAATLAQNPNQDLSPANDPARAFLSLYYGKLAVVEDQCVYRTMVDFKRIVFDKAAGAITPSRAALRIAFACRRMISRGWKSGLLGIYDPQNLIESFNDLDDYKDSMKAIAECR